MRILAAADDSGSLKEIICKRGTDTSSQKATQPDSIKTHCVETRLCKIQNFIIYQNYIICARSDGKICFYDNSVQGDKEVEDYLVVKEFVGCFANKEDVFISLFESFGLIYSCTQGGKITIIDPEDLNKKQKNYSVKSPVCAFIAHPLQKNIFAYGGQENDLKIISLIPKKNDDSEFELKIIFQGKNVKNDKLDLRVPIWISKIMFIDITVTGDTYKLITATRYGQIRKYDTSHGRKPIADFKVSEKPLLTLSRTDNPNEIICSDTHVTTAKFDISNGKLIGKYKGAVGSIQSLNSYLEGNLLVTGGLDRYVRVFDLDSREQIAKIYIGSQISCVMMLDDEQDMEEEETTTKDKNERKKKRVYTEAQEKEEEEALWNELEAKTEKNTRSNKKRR
ncbi:hypothetical protein PACTADRAFT_48828 [Pachysolen tannophilus NRRL Y-2460]|uniref:Ribosome biogenesis protein NSA1 n=1 Tax=Pachysolen tannophilus NRRL Y-2460 TaxID=669874 RepID=A0A1E4TZ64_PACTA|nr:hypothetical protein PACTADRAFT_48828 [Pachysolen tannophilus NRRL Y-2460]